LLRDLTDELRALGLTDATIDRHGYVMATVPSTTRKPDVPVVGFLAHVDTSPEMTGANVKPLVHRNYDGRDLVLPDDPTAVIRLVDDPALAEQLGHDLVTASGTTLLGADDKAGVAAVVTAAAYLVAHPEIAHGTVRIGFTPDEEIGRGAQHFDVSRFGARCAYTLDGGGRGEVEVENFSADQVTVTFHGFNTHPGYAKGRMVNAIKIASDFVTRLPADSWSPETTADREGFVHPYAVESSVERTTIRLLIRDFNAEGLREKEQLIEDLARQAAGHFPTARVDVAVEESYRNMREVLDHQPEVGEYARDAVRRVGLTVIDRPIRGGTDGSRLSFMGLPTPNLFVGQHGIHSRLEWVSAQDMEKAVEVIVALCRLWEERAQGLTGAESLPAPEPPPG
jgi:tripeptide aminopeptidase